MIKLFTKPDFSPKTQLQDLAQAYNKLQIKYEKLDLIYEKKKEELNAKYEEDVRAVKRLADELGERTLEINQREKLIAEKERVLKKREDDYLISIIKK